MTTRPPKLLILQDLVHGCECSITVCWRNQKLRNIRVATLSSTPLEFSVTILTAVVIWCLHIIISFTSSTFQTHFVWFFPKHEFKTCKRKCLSRKQMYTSSYPKKNCCKTWEKVFLKRFAPMKLKDAYSLEGKLWPT